MRRQATRAALLGTKFAQLKPVKRRGNRRYYQHHEVLIRRIRELLYDQGFTINGARNKLNNQASHEDVKTAETRAKAIGTSGFAQNCSNCWKFSRSKT